MGVQLIQRSNPFWWVQTLGGRVKFKGGCVCVVQSNGPSGESHPRFGRCVRSTPYNHYIYIYIRCAPGAPDNHYIYILREWDREKERESNVPVQASLTILRYKPPNGAHLGPHKLWNKGESKDPSRANLYIKLEVNLIPLTHSSVLHKFNSFI